MSTELSVYGVNVINNSSTPLKTFTPSIFSPLPKEIFLKIVLFLSYETSCTFAFTNCEIYERIKRNIVIISKNRFSASCDLIDRALSDVKYAQVKIQIQEIVKGIKLKNFPSQFSILHSKLCEEKFPFVNSLSSNVPLKDLKILMDTGSPMIKMAWIMGGIKHCLGFFDENFNKESFNYGDSTPTWIHDWLLEAVNHCTNQEVEDLICWYLGIHHKMLRYHLFCLYEERREDFSDLPEHYLKRIPIFIPKDADEYLARFFADLIEGDQISIVARLFKNLGKLLLTHPALNDNRLETFMLPRCIVSLINNRNREKVHAYLKENLQLDLFVKDIFNAAIHIDRFSKLLWDCKSIYRPSLVTLMFTEVIEMKLHHPSLQDRTLSCMLIDLPFKIVDTSKQTKMNILYEVSPKVLKTIKLENLKKELRAAIEMQKSNLKSTDLLPN